MKTLMNKTFGFPIAICIAMLTLKQADAQELGIQMGSMRKMYSEGMPAVLAKIKELGITELEGGPGQSNREEFKKLLKEYGLKIISTSGSFDRLSNADSLQKVIANAKDLGAQYIICYRIPHDGDIFTLANAKKGVEIFNAAGKTLKENGLTLSYHVHGYEFQSYEGGGKKTLFEYLMDNTSPDYVTFQMDVFWIKNPGQDPVALLKKYPNRWKSLHLKDRRIGSENNLVGRQDPENNVVLGTGDVGIEKALKTAMKLGIKHFFIEDESSRALEQIPQSIAYIKSLKLQVRADH